MSLLESIAIETGLPSTYLSALARTASYRYMTYEIDKKQGGKRRIDHPARELKLVQSWIAASVFASLPIHPAAFAYRKGLNVRDHAFAHAQRNYLLKVDFRDFFHSITQLDVIALLKRDASRFGLQLDAEDIWFVARIVCKDGRLTIGAPSSPAVSNVAMFDFDAHWSDLCMAQDVTYTRYADDLYFSTDRPNVLSPLLEGLRAFLKGDHFPHLEINEKKTAFTSRKRRRLVTGVLLTSDRRVSLGRARKRQIKSAVYKQRYSADNIEQRLRLKGLLAFAQSVDPLFVASLKQKFGEELNGVAPGSR